MKTNRLRLLPTTLLAAAWLLCTAIQADAQRISILSLNSQDFPQLSAEFIVTDAAGMPIQDFSDGDLELTEDGVPITGFTIECPPSAPPQRISALLVCDRSTSMSERVKGGTVSLMDLLKEGVRAFIRTVDFTPPTTVGITSFHGLSEIVHDFTADTNSLLAAVAKLTPKGATNYNPPLFDAATGAFPLFSTLPSYPPRYMVFITDGLPSDSIDVDAVVAECLAQNIKVFVITLAMPMFPPLADVARRTGGTAYERVYDADALKGIYTLIALKAQDLRPCIIRWTSFNGCANNQGRRQVRLTYKPKNISATMSYAPPASAAVSVTVEPEFLYFGETVPPQVTTRQVTLTANRTAFDITSATIPADAPYTVVDWGGTPPPFKILGGMSRTITVRFAPQKVAVQTSSLTFQSQPCTISPVTLFGGAASVDAPPTLELVSPVGKEIFAGCDSITIRWRGVAPLDTIVIEYSDNDGSTWKLITPAGLKFEHRWLPPVPGEHYRIRISVPGDHRIDTVRTVAGGGANTGNQATDRQLSGPSSIVILGDLMFLAETGRHIVSMVDLKTGLYEVVAGTGSPGYSNDGGQAETAKLMHPTGVAVYENYLYIADQSNHRVRRVDLTTRIITTVAGTGEPGFGGDGGKAVSALLQNPSHVLATETVLYITDRGNNRIRSVNLISGNIKTIAGGGSGPGDDTSPATSIELKSPAGMAIVSDPLHNTDTLYFAEELHHVIRRLDLRGGIISVAVGTGTSGYLGDGGRATSAWISSPQDVVAAGLKLYIADSRNFRVREFDRNTRTIRTVAGSGRNGFSGDEGPATSAAFSRVMAVGWLAPNRVLAADFENERVRMIALGDVGRRDSSNPSFSVATPLLKVNIPGRLVEFGNAALDAVHDSTLNEAVCNRGTLATMIDSITVIGANADDFSVVAGAGSQEIAPGGCQTIEIRFQPKELGTRTAQAVVHGSCGNLDTIKLRGIGLVSCGITSLVRHDFGDVPAGGTSGDVLLATAICNNGEIPQRGRITLSPADGPFAIVAGGGTFDILPGECHQVTVRFSPLRAGRVSATIEYGIPAYCATASTQLIGRGLASDQIEIAAEVNIPALRCDIRNRDTAIVIGNRGGSPLVITGAELAANNEGFSFTAPAPTQADPLTILPGATGSIGIRLQPATHGTKSATLRITAEGAPGPVDVALTGRRDSLRLAPDDNLVVFDGELAADRFPLDSFVTLRNTGTAAMTITSGTLSGADAGRFDIPPGQFPLIVAPGDSIRIRIRALNPAAGTSFSATLTLAAEPDCGTGITVDLFESGAGPAISVAPPVFRDLLCSGELERDTMLVVRNPGGSELRITSFVLRGTGAAAFIFAPALPIIVPAHGELALPIRFAAGAAGASAAELVLTGNAPGGDVVVELSGRREILAWTVSASALNIGHVMPGAQGKGTITLRNTGTETVRIDLPAVAGAFTVLTPSPVTIPAGEERTVEIGLQSAAEGDFLATLTLLEPRCGMEAVIPLSASVFTPAYTTVTLPNDSAGPGTRVALPVRISIPDRALFDLKGARGYSMVITFNGTVLVPVEARGMTIDTQTYDPKTMLRRVTLSGQYSGASDTLGVLVCDVPTSGLPGTPLTFEQFAWDTPQVFPATIDGSFTTLDSCYANAVIFFRPRALKIRPMPAGDHAVLEIDLDDVYSLRVAVADAAGREVTVAAERWYQAGYHELPLDLHQLPAGPYTLIVSTPFGQATERIVVVK